MLAEPYLASLVSDISVSDNSRMPAGYFRSKLFLTSSTTNPLVAAASPLLSLMERLSLSPTLPKIDDIRENIEHELFAFHSRLSGQHYAKELVLIADYLLSATIDELLGKNYLRMHNEPAEFKSFVPASLDEAKPQSRFFEIIDVIKHRLNQYLDIVELAYYCLITGFEGEHHFRADGRQTLDNLIEELYQLIQAHRVNKPSRLFKEQPKTSPEPTNHKPIVTLGLVAVCMLAMSYMGSHSLLEHKAQTLLLGHITQLG